MIIKIENENHFIIYEFNTDSKELKIIKNNGDNVLNAIFKDKDYDSFVSWLRSRVGGLSLKEILEIAKENELKSIKDNIKVKILN